MSPSLEQMKPEDLAKSGRSCGSCRLCCRVVAVIELGKPKGTWCEHAGPKGCGIYEERPKSCRDFACLWLWGFPGLEPEDRPDRTRVVFGFLGDEKGPSRVRHPGTGKRYPVLVGHEGLPGALSRDAALAPLRRFAKAGWAVIAMGSEQVRAIYFPDGTLWAFKPGDALPELSQ